MSARGVSQHDASSYISDVEETTLDNSCVYVVGKQRKPLLNFYDMKDTGNNTLDIPLHYFK